MALTKQFRSTVRERAQHDEAFRIGLLTEAAECFINGDDSTGKVLLRDYINATIGFKELAHATNKKPESLMRMLSEKGNPRANNLSEVLRIAGEHEGITFHVGAQ